MYVFVSQGRSINISTNASQIKFPIETIYICVVFECSVLRADSVNRADTYERPLTPGRAAFNVATCAIGAGVCISCVASVKAAT